MCCFRYGFSEIGIFLAVRRRFRADHDNPVGIRLSVGQVLMNALLSTSLPDGRQTRSYSVLSGGVGLHGSYSSIKLRQRKATMDELWEAAKVCRVARVMQPYLESIA